MHSKSAATRTSFTLASAILVTSSIAVHAQNNVLTWHNDNIRSGANTSEAILTPANVNSARFGLLAKVVVDGKVDAQPLYVSALAIPGKGTHNVLFVATEHDTVYAIDADSGSILWQKSMLPAGETTSDTRNCGQVTPEIGITATPAIDLKAGAHGTIYIVAMSKNGAGTYFHRIHALDLATAAELANGPVIVKGTYPGTGDGSTDGLVTFDPKQYKERPGLLLVNGSLVTSWGSHCDIRPYGGWMMTYSQSNLAQTHALDFVPDGSDAAPWNAGAGPAADAAGNIYVSLGNGTFDTTLTAQGFPAQGDFGNALVKLALTPTALSPIDYWTMYNSNAESNVDTDLGSGGLLLIPNQVDAAGKTRELVVAAGKDHNVYVADASNMGKFDASSNGTLYQQLTGSLPGGEWSSPASFNSNVYYGSVSQPLRSFEVQQAKLVNTPIQTTTTAFGYPGTTPSVSGYGSGNGIVWAPENTSPAVLHAYDASNLAKELYNSAQAANGRDAYGAGNKFVTPTIANGKVYLGTTNSVNIYGFLRLKTPPVADGVYTVTNAFSKLTMDDPASSANAGTGINQQAATTGQDQQWFFSFDGNGYYTIQNIASKLFLADTNGNTGPGTPLEQQQPTHDATQLWSINVSSAGVVFQNKATGLVLDDGGWSTKPGANVILWTKNGYQNQNWTLK